MVQVHFLSMGLAKSHANIAVSLPISVRDLVTEIAAGQGLSRSSWLRMLVYRELREQPNGLHSLTNDHPTVIPRGNVKTA